MATRRKWQFTTREAAETSARELQLQRDHLCVALNAVMHGNVRWSDVNYGTGEAYYRFGVIPRIAGCIVLVTFYAPHTGQKPHTAAYWETWVQDEIERYTQGVLFLAENAGAHWLIDLIASHQLDKRLRTEDFQLWTLTVRSDKTASAEVFRDSGQPPLLFQEIEYTDFPVELAAEIKLYVRDGVLMLPSEY
jgi:hypothetical protein